MKSRKSIISQLKKTSESRRNRYLTNDSFGSCHDMQGFEVFGSSLLKPKDDDEESYNDDDDEENDLHFSHYLDNNKRPLTVIGSGYDFKSDSAKQNRRNSSFYESNNNSSNYSEFNYQRPREIQELSDSERRSLALETLLTDDDSALARAYQAILGIQMSSSNEFNNDLSTSVEGSAEMIQENYISPIEVAGENENENENEIEKENEIEQGQLDRPSLTDYDNFQQSVEIIIPEKIQKSYSLSHLTKVNKEIELSIENELRDILNFSSKDNTIVHSPSIMSKSLSRLPNISKINLEEVFIKNNNDEKRIDKKIRKRKGPLIFFGSRFKNVSLPPIQNTSTDQFASTLVTFPAKTRKDVISGKELIEKTNLLSRSTSSIPLKISASFSSIASGRNHYFDEQSVHSLSFVIPSPVTMGTPNSSRPSTP